MDSITYGQKPVGMGDLDERPLGFDVLVSAIDKVQSVPLTLGIFKKPVVQIQRSGSEAGGNTVLTNSEGHQNQWRPLDGTASINSG